MLILLKLLGNVALGIDQGLLTDPGFGHLVLMRIAYLYVVTKNIVESNFQGRYARTLPFPFLKLSQIILPRVSDAAQLIELRRNTGTNNAPPVQQGRRIVFQLAVDAFGHLPTGIQVLAQRSEERRVGKE